MSDVNISKYRAQVIRQGSTPASPGFAVAEGQNPVDPSGSGQTHLPVTIATVSTGLSITESQILSGAGLVSQYIRGDGSLADFPATTGGGSSVSYYLNGSVSQGTIGGVAYREINRTPIFGAGTDISINANGYIASFITDAGDPNKLLIPAGNWNLETYFSASSNGGSPSFYVELYKYNGTTFTLIATSSSAPELIAFGTNLNPYFSTLAVPETVLALTDRLALRYYVTHSGRTITLHTENNHLCQVITTFTSGLTALNGLTSQVQYLTVGTSGTDFAISSASDTHTFNLPTASATNRGALSSADWTTFNNKTSNLGTVTSVGLSSATSGITIGSTPITTSGTITLAIATASGSQNGLLSSTDWTTFNGKQNALTNPVTGTGVSGQVAYWNGTNSITSDADLLFDGNNVTVGGNIILTNGVNRLIRIGSASNYNYDLQTVGDDFQIIEAGATIATPRLTFTYPTGAATFSSKITAATLSTIGTAVAGQNVQLNLNGVSGKAQRIEFQNSGVQQWLIGAGAASETSAFEIFNSTGIISLSINKSNNAATFYNSVSVGDFFRLTKASSVDIQAYTGSAYTNLFYDAASHNWQTSGGTAKMVLVANGNLLVGTTTDNGAKLQVSGFGTISSGFQISGGPAGYGGAELVLNSVSGALNAIYTNGGGAVGMYFDHRGTSNSGFWVFRNGTSAANTLLTIASTGAATFSSSVTAGGGSLFNANSNTLSQDILTVRGGGASGAFGFRVEANNGDDLLFVNSLSYNVIMGATGGNVLVGTTTAGSSKLRIVGLPTSAAGLSSGDVYSLAGTLMIA